MVGYLAKWQYFKVHSFYSIIWVKWIPVSVTLQYLNLFLNSEIEHDLSLEYFKVGSNTLIFQPAETTHLWNFKMKLLFRIGMRDFIIPDLWNMY